MTLIFIPVSMYNDCIWHMHRGICGLTLENLKHRVCVIASPILQNRNLLKFIYIFLYLFTYFDRTEAAAQTPMMTGVIKDFCKSKGHGYVTPSDGSVDLFVHISE